MMAKRIIYTDPSSGKAVVVTPSPRFTCEQLIADAKLNPVPDGVSHQIIEDTAIPTDRQFRDAWEVDGVTVKEDVTKSKTIAHEKRRKDRYKEFKPHDNTISLSIPGADATAAENARAAIRTKYTTMQTNIDNATDIAGIKTALGG